MKSKYYLLCIVFFVLSSCFKQNNDEYANKLENFATSLEDHYGADYPEKIQFDELNSFSESIIGLNIGSYVFQDYYGNRIKLLTEEKPVLLESFASWCAPCISAIPALNQLSEDYPDVRFIILAHDMPGKLEKYAAQLNPNIHLIPSYNELNPNKFVKLKIGEFQSVFPFPTTFSIDANGIIQNVMIGGPRAGNFGGQIITEEEVFETNMMRLSREIELLLTK